MKPVVVAMKSLGIRMVLYLDDMILMANSQGVQPISGVHTECGQECNIIKSPNRILRIQSGFHHHDNILTIPGIYLTSEISSTTSRWDMDTTERHCTSVRNDGRAHSGSLQLNYTWSILPLIGLTQVHPNYTIHACTEVYRTCIKFCGLIIHKFLIGKKIRAALFSFL